MDKKALDPNAIRALNEMKLELANELGISDTFINNKDIDPATNILTAGPVGGLMTRKLIEMGEKELMDD